MGGGLRTFLGLFWEDGVGVGCHGCLRWSGLMVLNSGRAGSCCFVVKNVDSVLFSSMVQQAKMDCETRESSLPSNMSSQKSQHGHDAAA